MAAASRVAEDSEELHQDIRAATSEVCSEKKKKAM